MADESDAAKLINGVKIDDSNHCEVVQNEHSRKLNGDLVRKTFGKASGAHRSSMGTGTSNGTNNGNEESVFKSANWLSDSELIFSLTNQVGGLVRALRVFQELDIGIKHVESRKSKRRDSEFEIFVDIDCSDRDKMRKLVHHLRYVNT